VFVKSPIRLKEGIPEVMENPNENLTPRMRNLMALLWASGKIWSFRSRRSTMKWRELPKPVSDAEQD